jgi:hypothetical protein
MTPFLRAAAQSSYTQHGMFERVFDRATSAAYTQSERGHTAPGRPERQSFAQVWMATGRAPYGASALTGASVSSMKTSQLRRSSGSS